jgi:hypothetical protein
MRYAAFLSYSHADARWAQWLHRRLENYRVPSRLVGTLGPNGPIGPRLGTIFRDRDELPTSGDLSTTIRAALAESAALIVVCSPAAAQSRWVRGEIEAFQALGRSERIACFIVAGEPAATGSESACFSPALTTPGADGIAHEPLAADARAEGDGRDRAFLRLVAGLLGVSYDVLARRETQRRHRRLLAVTVASVVGMAIAIGLAATAWVARNDAQRRQAQAEDILGFMLGDLREKLTTVGRLDLMRAVDGKATAYFATLNPRDLTDRALEEQARSLTGIGQVRLDEGKHDEAMSAFREAYARSSALYDRQPGNGQRLFDRAQAEYWIGLVFWREGRLDDAQTWLTRYRDSALKLAPMDPGNFDWQREVAYGHHNLAVLDQGRGRNKEAEQALRSELALFHEWLATHPNDNGLRSEAANAASFLGSLALTDGRLAEAQARYEEQLAGLTHNRKAEPDNATWKQDWITAQVLLAQAQAAQGRFDDARRSIADASVLAATLAAQDPSNREWQTLLGYCHWWQARLLTGSDPARAAQEARAAERLFAAGNAVEPEDKRFLVWLAKSRLLLAELDLQRGAADSARDLATQAQAMLAPAWKREPADDLRMLLARSHLLDGMAAQARGDGGAARSAWSQAERLLRDGLGEPPAFDRLDLLVRVLQAQDRDADAAPYLARLDKSGYAPLPPWMSSAALTATR